MVLLRSSVTCSYLWQEHAVGTVLYWLNWAAAPALARFVLCAGQRGSTKTRCEGGASPPTPGGCRSPPPGGAVAAQGSAPARRFRYPGTARARAAAMKPVGRDGGAVPGAPAGPCGAAGRAWLGPAAPPALGAAHWAAGSDRTRSAGERVVARRPAFPRRVPGRAALRPSPSRVVLPTLGCGGASRLVRCLEARGGGRAEPEAAPGGGSAARGCSSAVGVAAALLLSRWWNLKNKQQQTRKHELAKNLQVGGAPWYSSHLFPYQRDTPTTIRPIGSLPSQAPQYRRCAAPISIVNASESLWQFWHWVPVLMCSFGLSLSPLWHSHWDPLSVGTCDRYTAAPLAVPSPCYCHAAASHWEFRAGERQSSARAGVLQEGTCLSLWPWTRVSEPYHVLGNKGIAKRGDRELGSMQGKVGPNNIFTILWVFVCHVSWT